MRKLLVEAYYKLMDFNSSFGDPETDELCAKIKKLIKL